jgi:uncharacterized protein YggE
MNGKLIAPLTMAAGALLFSPPHAAVAMVRPAPPSSPEAAALSQPTDERMAGIAVTGEGKVSVCPDMALLNLRVSAKRGTAEVDAMRPLAL